MEIQQIRHLIAAVECGNLLKAADACHISQSGLSRSIRSLEERLGVQLLIRKSTGVEPTVYGRSVLRRAYLIMNEVSRTVDELRALQASEVGDITFGVTQNYGYYCIPELVAELQADHPGVRASVNTGGFVDLVRQLKAGDIDFVFGLLGPIEENDELEAELLREHYSRVVARSNHPLACKQGDVTPEELSVARWATLRGEGFQRNFQDYFTARGLRSPIQAVRTDSLALIRNSIAAADLLAVLPPDVVHREIDCGDLIILPCEAPAEQTHVGIVRRRDSLVTPPQKKIINLIRKRF